MAPTETRRLLVDRGCASGPGIGGTSNFAGEIADGVRTGAADGNLVAAEGMARELGRISLAEALELTILIARKERSGYRGLLCAGSSATLSAFTESSLGA
jgi:hypothetical protein